ncbi:Uncharacterised protein [Streptococcus pneumoniae]|nr:Uncharacterised protein [Streptococcus pneumoniae]
MEHKTPKHIVAVAGYLTNETHFIPCETWEVQPYNLIGRL